MPKMCQSADPSFPPPAKFWIQMQGQARWQFMKYVILIAVAAAACGFYQRSPFKHTAEHSSS